MMGISQRCPFKHRRNHLEQTSSESNTVVLKRRIGSTTYDVSLHFSASGSETVEQKILKLIAQDAKKGAM